METSIEALNQCWLQTDGNAWLTEDEKRLLREKMAEKQAEEERKRRTVTVSFDVLGRQVLVTEQDIVGPW